MAFLALKLTPQVVENTQRLWVCICGFFALLYKKFGLLGKKESIGDTKKENRRVM
jgi:hypothetical protein